MVTCLHQLLSTDYDRYDINAARRVGVPIANYSVLNSVAVAEIALVLMLVISRRLVWQHANVSSGCWRTNDWHEKHL